MPCRSPDPAKDRLNGLPRKSQKQRRPVKKELEASGSKTARMSATKVVETLQMPLTTSL